jgi:hypothetical protein
MRVAARVKTLFVAPKFQLAPAPATELPPGILGSDGALANPAVHPIKRIRTPLATEAIAWIPGRFGQILAAVAAEARLVRNEVTRVGLKRGVCADKCHGGSPFAWCGWKPK